MSQSECGAIYNWFTVCSWLSCPLDFWFYGLQILVGPWAGCNSICIGCINWIKFREGKIFPNSTAVRIYHNNVNIKLVSIEP